MQTTISLLIFIITYLFFVIFPNHRAWSALAGATFIILFGIFSPLQALQVVNWNVIAIFVGTLLVAEVFNESNMPSFLAEQLAARSKTSLMAILSVCLLTGILSAFLENVAVVLLIAPIAFALAKKLNISPVGFIIAIAISSNLQGTATLIGDPPSMILGGFTKMGFNDFFFFQGKPGIFFAVQIGALLSLGALYLIFNNLKEKIFIEPKEKILSYTPSIILTLMIIGLSISSYFDPDFFFLAGTICMVFGIWSIIWNFLKNKQRKIYFDIETTIFLIGIFILIGSLSHTGVVSGMATWMSSFFGQNILVTYISIIVLAVLFSAFIDNVPFLTLMIPVVQNFSNQVGIAPYLFLFGLLIGACLGGNITPLGASANIVAINMLKKKGFTVNFRQFVAIGLPFTLVAVLGASIFIWLVWR